MSGYGTGYEIKPEMSAAPFLAQHLSALPDLVRYAEERFERRDLSELDFSNHRKIRDKARGGYFRPYGLRPIEEAEDSGVVAYCLAGDRLVLLCEPGFDESQPARPWRR